MYRTVTYIVEQNRYIQRGPTLEHQATPQSALASLALMMETCRDALHFAECMDHEGNSQWRLSIGADT